MTKYKYTVLSLYKFFEIKNIFNFKNKICKVFKGIAVKGIVLVAPEGININISLSTNNLEQVLGELKKIFPFKNQETKVLNYDKHIFRKFKVKIKKEILTTRNLKQTNPMKVVGEYIKPEDWESFINQPNTILIDMRNDYEIKIGTFKNALNPKCKDFTELLKWLKNDLIKKESLKNKKIAMFCTGGIRCEKASVYLNKKGFKNVFQLKGGILNYLKTVKKKHSLWRGECFVFDNRVSLKHDLVLGTYSICSGCRTPISLKDKKSKKYEEGVSCNRCYDTLTKTQKTRFRMRQRQIVLAKKAGKKHIFQKEF